MNILTLTAGIAVAVFATGTAIARSEPVEDNADRTIAFDGFKIGASIDNRRHEVKRTAPTLTDRIDDRSGGTGYRGFVGYDRTIGGVGLIGIEAGFGKGGKDVAQTVAGGAYRMDPGWAWDASARFGVLPIKNLLLYGRAGYGWTRAKETVAFTGIARTPFARSRTEGGFMYGFGAELAVTRDIAIRTEFDQTDFGQGFKAARLQLGGVFRF